MWRWLSYHLDFALLATLQLRSYRAIQKSQLQRLRILLEHANAHVPMWQRFFMTAGIDSKSFNDLADLARLPITNQSTYRGKTPEEYLDAQNPRMAQWRSTSSAKDGQPFPFVPSNYRMQSHHEDEARFRFLVWQHFSPTYLDTVRVAQVIEPFEFYRSKRLVISNADYWLHPDPMIDAIVSFKPDILESDSVTLGDIANRALLRNSNIRIPCAISFGEPLTEPLRARISGALNTKVYARYGIEEVGSIAMECAEHNGLHIYCESVIVEIVDQSGTALHDEETGHIVVTDLNNLSMPFLRYNTGDTGKISTKRCSCGLYLPRLWISSR